MIPDRSQCYFFYFNMILTFIILKGKIRFTDYQFILSLDPEKTLWLKKPFVISNKMIQLIFDLHWPEWGNKVLLHLHRGNKWTENRVQSFNLKCICLLMSDSHFTFETKNRIGLKTFTKTFAISGQRDT